MVPFVRAVREFPRVCAAFRERGVGFGVRARVGRAVPDAFGAALSLGGRGNRGGRRAACGLRGERARRDGAGVRAKREWHGVERSEAVLRGAARSDEPRRGVGDGQRVGGASGARGARGVGGVGGAGERVGRGRERDRGVFRVHEAWNRAVPVQGVLYPSGGGGDPGKPGVSAADGALGVGGGADNDEAEPRSGGEAEGSGVRGGSEIDGGADGGAAGGGGGADDRRGVAAVEEEKAGDPGANVVVGVKCVCGIGAILVYLWFI